MSYAVRYVLWSLVALLFVRANGSGVQCTPGVKTYSRNLAPLQAASAVFGVVTDVEDDSLLRASGYACLEESTQSSFSPLNLSRSRFEERLQRLRSSVVRVYSCNVFLPGSLKLVGPAVQQDAVLAYADSVFRRAREAGLSVVVLGSGEARRVPQGVDSATARRQFVGIVRRMGELASAQGIVLAMENLNRGETNFGNSLASVTSMIREINHPSVKVTADIYHMLREHESAQSIIDAGDLLVHCHIAEERERARPGRYGEDFRPYFSALKRIGYKGKIMLECRWENMPREAREALQYLAGQWGQ